MTFSLWLGVTFAHETPNMLFVLLPPTAALVLTLDAMKQNAQPLDRLRGLPAHCVMCVGMGGVSFLNRFLFLLDK